MKQKDRFISYEHAKNVKSLGMAYIAPSREFLKLYLKQNFLIKCNPRIY